MQGSNSFPSLWGALRHFATSLLPFCFIAGPEKSCQQIRAVATKTFPMHDPPHTLFCPPCCPPPPFEKQESPFSAFYYPLLRKHQHYVPLRRDLSDLCVVVAQLQANHSRAHQLAISAAEFATTMLAPQHIVAYVAHLLRGYASLQRFTPQMHPEAKSWSRSKGRSSGLAAGKDGSSRSSSKSVRGCNNAGCCHRHPKACKVGKKAAST